METKYLISSIHKIGDARICKFATQTALEGQSAAVQASILHSLAVAAKACDASDDYADDVIPAVVSAAIAPIKALYPEIDEDQVFACVSLALVAACAAHLKGEA